MRCFVTLAGLVIPAVALEATAAADAMTVTGSVVDAHSRWTSDGHEIVTEATVRTPDGQDVSVIQLGGSVDGIGMIQMPGPAVLREGMQVELAAHHGFDNQLRAHTVVDSVTQTLVLDFVRTGPTKAGHSLYWESGCIFLTMAAEGTRELPASDEQRIIDASIATWNDGCASCSYIKIVDAGTVANAEVGGKDKVNLLKFRDTSWCRPAVGDAPAFCYSAAAAGITTATFVDDSTSARDGAIVDADIEINGVDFAIAENGQTLGAAPCAAELQNTLTHELGHLHGLEHPCLSGDDPPRVDDQGNPVPDCGATSDPKIEEATMYPFQECGETKKETLSDDDIAGVCAIYPLAKDPMECEPVGGSSGGGCCSASDGSLPSTIVIGGVLCFVAGLKKSRRRRRVR